ncbi:YihY/virulence factor BrkB family protein [Sphingomonas sp. KRR8]|uniref:YihY/virulence factor BrkB family protein n=1 Tax=Sphingomonas sp. KRR8 TaxID=2942996 RepID=UPI002021F53B|nr:YihY/virulence factor BrkB family protein [Sphingomonas sp. KRR8]URD60600.1 YihY/virulence factor BrkB family protein [Sphingomonas sp. KRR8]
MLGLSPESPEARRKRLASLQARFGTSVVDRLRPGQRPFEIIKRVLVGVYSDGFIHAGNLAYLSLVAMFPFFITAAALASLLGRSEDAMRTVNVVLLQVPPDIRKLLVGPVQEVLTARTGPLLWFGGIVGLWTAASFIETLRDILRRAYGVKYNAPFWEYRLISIGFILGSVLLLMTAFAASVALSSIEALILHVFPRLAPLIGSFSFYKMIPAGALYVSIYVIFVVLTPRRYRRIECRKWPGALLVTLWWLATAELLPQAMRLVGGYSLTYGSLAGVMIALLFFFVIGLGVVMGAELNAALAETEAVALEGERYSGPFADQLPVEEPSAGPEPLEALADKVMLTDKGDGPST